MCVRAFSKREQLPKFVFYNISWICFQLFLRDFRTAHRRHQWGFQREPSFEGL